MISEADRLEKLEKVVEELIVRSSTEPVIVEGARDIHAMRELGIDGIVQAVNTGNSIMNLCESLCSEHDRFIIMTDWDKRGGRIAHQLERGLESCDAKYDSKLRAQIARLTKKEIKDVEGLPSYLDRLRKSVLTKTPSDRRNIQHPDKD